MSTDRKDNVLSLGARDDLLAIVASWPALHAALGASGGSALTGLPGAASPERPLVLRVDVLDLMREIEDSARFWGQVLCEETDWAPSTSAMPTLLAEVAMRHGHFTSQERDALEFCDAAHDFRERVRKTLVRGVPPRYVGPCREAECVGELYVAADKDAGRCRVCGTAFTLGEQREWLDAQMAERLMTVTEIWRALSVLGEPIPVQTIHSWVRREKLLEAIPEQGLYRLADARGLAEKRAGHAA